MKVTSSVLSTCLFALITAAAAHAQAGPPQRPQPTIPQQQQGNPFPPRDPRTGLPNQPDNPFGRNPDETGRKARDIERQKRLVGDTDRLLALATQLKADVDKTDRHMLSIDVIRRSEEIEKLAKSIKDRAKE